MKQCYMVVDVALCHDCNNCFMACKDEHVDNTWPPYTDQQPRHGHRWMNIHRKERGQFPRIDVAYLPMPCQHCQDAPCMKAYPECFTRRGDGIVLIKQEQARGVKGLVDSCPYGAIYWNEHANIAQKCTMCAHLLDGEGVDGSGKIQMPRCAHSCPTNAITFYKLEPDEMERKMRTEGLETYRPGLATRPNVYYKNLYRFERAFVTGGVLKNGDCVQGVKVTLSGQGVDASQNTDCFGEFKFDALMPGSYTLTVDGVHTAQVQVEQSVNIGNIIL